MITNRSPLWIRAMAEMEEDTLISVVDSHITSEFLEAALPCESSPAGGAGINGSTDPFYLTPAQQSALHARSMSPNGQPPWAGHTGTDPCPTCGRRPWWFYQDQNPEWWSDEEDDDKSERDDFLDDEE